MYWRSEPMPKHGLYTAETLAMKRQISALARMARETLAAIE